MALGDLGTLSQYYGEADNLHLAFCQVCIEARKVVQICGDSFGVPEPFGEAPENCNTRLYLILNDASVKREAEGWGRGKGFKDRCNCRGTRLLSWIPACAGMTDGGTE